MATDLHEIQYISGVGMYGTNTWVHEEEDADAVPEKIDGRALSAMGP